METELTLWDVNAASAATGLSRRYVRGLFDKRAVPVVKIGHYVRVRPDDLRAFIEQNTQPARPEQVAS